MKARLSHTHTPELLMTDRYANYSRLKIDHPLDRVLRITFDRPETYNSVDAETHTQLTNIWRDINDDPDMRCNRDGDRQGVFRRRRF